MNASQSKRNDVEDLEEEEIVKLLVLTSIDRRDHRNRGTLK